MKWVFFSVKAVLIFFILWLLSIYLYGEFYLVDNVVPDVSIEVDEWLHSYYLAGAVSAITALICSTVWFYFGVNFSGGRSGSVTHTILWLVSFICGFIVALILIAPSQEGSGLSFFFVGLLAPLGFYLNSLFNSAEAVKFIPPLGSLIHG